MKALEEQRAKGTIGSPLEARVILRVGTPSFRALCEAHRETLAEMCVVSAVDIQMDEPPCAAPNAAVAGLPGAAPAIQAGLVDLRVERAQGEKCQRCWKHLTSVGSTAAHPQLCERCARVVTAQTG